MEDLYDNPGPKKVHFDQSHKEERVVNIYVSEESLTVYENPWMEGMSAQYLPRPAEAQHPASVVSANTGKRNLVAVFLGLLCLLFLATTIGLGVQTSKDKTNWEKERNQLRADHADLNENIDQLTANNTQLVRERDDLLMKLYKTACPGGVERFNRSSYHITNEKKNWRGSKTLCESKGAQLLVISSTEEEEFVIKYVLPSGGRAWIGLKIKDTGKNWGWVDGTPLTPEQSQRVKQLNDGNRQKVCVAMEKSHKEDGDSWHGVNCWQREYGICERRVY